MKLRRHSAGPDEAAPRLSQELPSQASGPWTRWATSVTGCRTIFAPSKAQPPAAAPGVSGLEQPLLRVVASLAWFFSQAGSLKSAWTRAWLVMGEAPKVRSARRGADRAPALRLGHRVRSKE